MRSRNVSLRLAMAVFAVTLMTGRLVHAESPDSEFNVSSATVLVIKKSLAERHIWLAEHFQAGAIGLTDDGLVALREAGNLAKDVRARLESLVADDNKDRSTLYREIARANGRPDWENNWRSVFAQRWISRAPSGWYFRESGGRWVKKP